MISASISDNIPPTASPISYVQEVYLAPEPTAAPISTSLVPRNLKLDHLSDDVVESTSITDDIPATPSPISSTQTTGTSAVHYDDSGEDDFILTDAVYKPMNGNVDQLWVAGGIMVMVIIALIKIVCGFLSYAVIKANLFRGLSPHSD